jgi:hypothetical protein
MSFHIIIIHNFIFSKCVILIISSIVAYFLYKLLNFVRFIEIKKSIIQELIFLLNKKNTFNNNETFSILF